MKKIRITAALLIAALGLVSCVKDGLLPEGPAVYAGQNLAYAEISDGETRTSLSGDDSSGYETAWTEGDKFALVYQAGGASATVEYTLSEGAGSTRGSFSYPSVTKDAIPSSEAYFPASMVHGTGSDVCLVWPADQTYTADDFSSAPMWAEGTGSFDGPFSFRNLGGLLRVTAKGSGVVKTVTVSANEPLAGSFTNSAGVLTFAGKGGNDAVCSITLDCGDGVELTQDGVDFYVSVPAGEYSGVTISFNDDMLCRCTKSAPTGATVKIGRSRITPAVMEGIKGFGPGSLLAVDKEWDKTQADIMGGIYELAPSLQTNILGQMMLGLFLAKNMHFARLIYATEDPSGALVPASGLVAFPFTSTPGDMTMDKMVSFQHGTRSIAQAPSFQDVDMEMLPACSVGKGNLIGVMADYLGYGVSQTPDLQHPYLSLKLTGSTCADMISASDSYVALNGIGLKAEKLDLVGYSQGGAATLATLVELENRDFDYSRINEVWAGAGPYDILGFFNAFKNVESYDRTGFIPFAIRGICYSENLSIPYPKLYNAEMMARVDLETLFSTKQLDDWHSVLGKSIRDILNPCFYEDNFGGDTDLLKLRAAMERNSVTSCPAPANIAKVKLYHSETDDTVPYACSESLAAKWGITEITKLKKQNDHMNAGIEFMLRYCGFDFMVDYI